MRTEENWTKEMLMYFETYIGLAAFIFITVIFTVQVVDRYVFSQSWTWIKEISVIAFVIIIYCDVSGAVTTQQNMRINIVLTVVPFMAKKVLMILDTIINAVFVGWLSYYLYEIIQNTLQLNQMYSVTRIPRVSIYISLTLMLILSIIRSVQEVIKLAGGKEKELGKSRLAFDLDAIWGEGKAARGTYLAQQKPKGTEGSDK